VWVDGEIVSKKRISVPIRMPVDLHARLAKAAEERDVSANYLANLAVEDFVKRLIPPGEIEWTRRG